MLRGKRPLITTGAAAKKQGASGRCNARAEVFRSFNLGDERHRQDFAGDRIDTALVDGRMNIDEGQVTVPDLDTGEVFCEHDIYDARNYWPNRLMSPGR